VLLLAASLAVLPVLEDAGLARDRRETGFLGQLGEVQALTARRLIEHTFGPGEATLRWGLGIDVREPVLKVRRLALRTLILVVHVLVPHHSLLDLSEEDGVQVRVLLLGGRVLEYCLSTDDVQAWNR